MLGKAKPLQDSLAKLPSLGATPTATGVKQLPAVAPLPPLNVAPGSRKRPLAQGPIRLRARDEQQQEPEQQQLHPQQVQAAVSSPGAEQNAPKVHRYIDMQGLFER